MFERRKSCGAGKLAPGAVMLATLLSGCGVFHGSASDEAGLRISQNALASQRQAHELGEWPPAIVGPEAEFDQAVHDVEVIANAFADSASPPSAGWGPVLASERTFDARGEPPDRDGVARQPIRSAQADPSTTESAGGASLEEANQAIANPLAQATLVIVENDTLFLDGDAADGTEVTNVTIFEPLVPISVTEGWSLVNRPIIPFALGADIPVAGSSGTGAGSTTQIDSVDGMGDISFFSLLTPIDDSPIKWGVGPIFRFPTATDSRLGAEKWSAGPAGVALYSSPKFTIGALNQNLFSFAGDDDRDNVAVSTLQYFAFYNFTPEWGVGAAPIISYNWDADGGDKLLLPVGLGLTHTFRIGETPTRLLFEGQYYAVQRDTFGPEWNARVALAMFFPPLFD